MKTIRLFLVVWAIAAALAVHAAAAKDDPLEFLHLMEKNGFPDIAVDYLNRIKEEPNAPPEVMRLWDLEMSISKREMVKAKLAYSPAQAKELSDESKALMEQFIKKNPDMPEAIQVAAEWATERAMEAQNQVASAMEIKDAAEKSALLAKARQTFAEIRPQFVKARISSEKVYAGLTNRVSPSKREIAYLQVGENKLNVAMIDFFVAMTLESGSERAAAFDKVAKDLDAIYHEYADDYSGWKAHFFNGRILQEEGKFQDARDVYEEVTVHDANDVVDSSAGGDAAPNLRQKRKTGYEDFFADVEQQYLRVLYQISPKDYRNEFTTWRSSHKVTSETCVGYQGLTYDYARNLYEVSKEPKNAARKDALIRDALRLLKEVAKVDGPYQTAAILLRREINPNATEEDSFDDDVLDANTAVGKKDWAEAADLYLKALKAVTAKTEKKRIADVRNAYVGCIHQQAMELYKNKKIDDAVNLITAMLKQEEFRATPSAPAAAVFAMTIKYYELLAAPDETEKDKQAREPIVAKVVALAKAIIGVREWTAREEADSARIILLRLALDKSDRAQAAGKKAAAAGKPDDAKRLLDEAQADVKQADEVFKGINLASHEYPKALTILGYQHWHRYRGAKKDWERQNKGAAPDKALQAQLDDDRAQAVDYTKKAVDGMQDIRIKGAPMSKELRESSVLLAQMYVEGEDYKTARTIYQGLVDDIVNDPKTKSLDELTLMVFNGAMQAYLQDNNMDKASIIAAKILELGPDDVNVNEDIINFAKRLDFARKQAVAEGDANGAAAKLQAVVDLEAKVMINLSKRDKLGPTVKLEATTMIWLVQVLSKLGRDDADDAATQLVKKITNRALNDDEFDAAVGKAKGALDARAASILAKQGKYGDALEAIESVINQHKNSLAPLMARAEILTQWAAKDSTKYDDAIGRWDELAKRLENAPYTNKAGKKEKMPEYYDALYNEYFCFYKLAEKNSDKAMARQAFDLINPLLQFDPKIQGPDRDRELSFKFFQLAGKLADMLGVDRPKLPSIRSSSSGRSSPKH